MRLVSTVIYCYSPRVTETISVRLGSWLERATMVTVYTKPRVRPVIVTVVSPALASILPWSLPPLQYIRYPVTVAPEVGAVQVTLILVGPAGMAPKLPGWPAAGPTSIRVTWAAPTSGATITGYQIYWSGGSDQGSMDANAGDTAVTITGRSSGVAYTLTIVALSNQLPSKTDMVTVTLGE